MRIEGASALVVGGASGLGAATARRLLAGGAEVTIADLHAEKGEALAEELGARFVACDVTEGSQVESAVAAAGPLRISVCCAGIGWAEKTAASRGPHALDPFESVVRVNLIGTFNVLSQAAARMAAHEPVDGERGVCVLTASVAAFEGQIGQLPYASSKAGIVGLTLVAARDLASKLIRVMTIAPGTFDTPILARLPQTVRDSLGQMTPHPRRLGQPDEFARLALAIIDNPMLNGETIRLDGAIRMQPK
jgi:NAD(P)-dependent dehydrogenase (short-subunit alcohol dehydrogenase family)